MQRRTLQTAAALLALATTQPGCHLLMRQRKPSRAEREVAQFAAKSRRPVQRVGVVTLVNEEDRFVLIDNGSVAPPAIGAKLLSYSGDTPSAELKASAVRRRPFTVADVVNGSPRVGDEIFESADGVPALPVRK